MRRALLLALLTVAACTCSAPPVGSASRATPPLPHDAANVADLAPPALVQVVVTGTVTAPGAPAGRMIAVLTDGPCFQPGSHFVATAAVNPGKPYRIEAYPPGGSVLDLCVALVVGNQRLTPWHGRGENTPLQSTASGRTIFQHVDVKVGETVPVRVPDGLRLD
ncbi:MAG: hypothetical protein EXR72_12750 [Myxococcales bacterium]|nr:hypothetical protein [Myxococcales bacterium]